jgi:dTMP kinase
MSGKFVVIEGIDGSGKTSLVKLMAAELRKRGFTVHETYEPTHGEIGALARKAFSAESKHIDDPLAWAKQEMLLAADRMHHLFGEVNPALETHDYVICDRYVGSGYAYGMASRPNSVSTLSAHGFLCGMYAFAWKPDYCILVDVPIEVAVERMAKRTDKTRYDVDVELLKRVRSIYNSEAAEHRHWYTIRSGAMTAEQTCLAALDRTGIGLRRTS